MASYNREFVVNLKPIDLNLLKYVVQSCKDNNCMKNDRHGCMQPWKNITYQEISYWKTWLRVYINHRNNIYVSGPDRQDCKQS